MPRYIDADKLVGTFLGFSMPDPNVDTMIRQSTVIRTIHEMPTADVREVKRGRWIKDRLCTTNGGTYGVRRCSICEDYYQDVGYGWNYCPNCGADMRGES